MNRDDRVRIVMDSAAASWFKDLHGQVGTVVRDDGICAVVRLADDIPREVRVHYRFLVLIEAARHDLSAKLGQRYWRYDPDEDEYVTVQHDWIKNVSVMVDRYGVRIDTSRPFFNPGASRWLGNRMIEAAAIYEMLVADPPPHVVYDTTHARAVQDAETAEAEGELSIDQAEQRIGEQPDA